MKYLIFVILLIAFASAYANNFVDEMPTFEGVCQLRGDWCSTKCQIAGGRDGICNKVQLCICRQL